MIIIHFQVISYRMTSDKRIIRVSSNAYRWHLHQHAGAAAANKVKTAIVV
jgi:hypothetical protein